MAAVVVATLERDNWTANTDVIVAVDVARRRLTWVPRDLWSPLIRVGKMVLIPRTPKPWWRQQLHRLRGKAEDGRIHRLRRGLAR
ncbi:MAG: hypothetical protein E5W55_25135 [Mesorhizobium sp.]|nr:MAG: hypothetical protein E5W55_25135 [Mesorhizobium sp.]